ncbi:hypothetical protein RR46_09409 [Papilio xuthus]|uniref:Uncharacterized protein n=1 Tax=Papilio xuthus TaxID=66420 RepID=A0A194PYT4_PAPXU|nr:hypothetical protein RR46_09409 [Papilio xuthus]
MPSRSIDKACVKGRTRWAECPRRGWAIAQGAEQKGAPQTGELQSHIILLTTPKEWYKGGQRNLGQFATLCIGCKKSSDPYSCDSYPKMALSNMAAIATVHVCGLRDELHLLAARVANAQRSRRQRDTRLTRYLYQYHLKNETVEMNEIYLNYRMTFSKQNKLQ